MAMKINIKPHIVEKYMIENGLSIKRLSEQSNIGEPTIRRAINGGTISPVTANKLLKYLNVPIDDLVEFNNG